MQSHKFLHRIIEESIELSKNSIKKSSFDKLLNSILEQDVTSNLNSLPTKIQPPPIGGQQPDLERNPDQNEEESALPARNAVITIQLTRLMVQAFFTDIEAIKDDVEEKGNHKKAEFIQRELNKLIDLKSGLADFNDAKEAVRLVQNLVRMGMAKDKDIFVDIEKISEKLNSANTPQLILLIIKSLLTPSTKISKNDPFIGKKIEELPQLLDDLTQLDLNIQGNLEKAVDSAKIIYKVISELIAVNATGDFSIDPGA